MTTWTNTGAGVRPRVRDSFDELRRLYDQLGEIWYVDSSKGASGDGKSWQNAFTNLIEGVAATSDRDIIMMAPGDYDEGAVVPITTQITIIGAGNFNQHRTMVYSSSATHDLMTINAHHVTIDGVGFSQLKDTKDAIKVSTTASFHKSLIQNCRFDGYGAGEYGVHTGSTYDSPDIVVENCRFHSWQTAAIYANATRGVFRNNLVVMVAAKKGIHYVPTGGDRGGGFVLDNDIIGVNSTDTGIAMGAVNAGNLTVSGNRVVGCGTANITQFANGQYRGTENYASSTAGGAIIDIDS